MIRMMMIDDNDDVNGAKGINVFDEWERLRCDENLVAERNKNWK
jgi:hypothetical protein